jgi:formate dehydrogenase subunit gamma
MGEPTRMYERWDIHQRTQHWLMLSSFILVSVTGIPIKFAYMSWAQSYAQVFGNFEILFGIHKLGAVIMTTSALYHLLYLIIKTITGKLRWTMIPIIKDVRDFALNFAYFCELRAKPAQFKKYSYKEKMDYWAVYWGTPIMVLSGLVLWFPGKAVSFMLQWLIESSHFLHQDEAMLAILFIFSIHLYNVHFSPDFFPMNTTWLTGKVSREIMEHEHSLELVRLEEEEKSEKQIPGESTIAH